MSDNRYEYLGSQAHSPIVGQSDDNQWERARGHRNQILQMLPANVEGRRGIIGIFGVGDGTFLDLQKLLDRFHEVHLIDEEGPAIEQAIRSQSTPERHRIFYHAMELSGVRQTLEDYSREPDENSLNSIDETIRQHTLPDKGPFDVVVSLSTLTNLTRHAANCIGNDPEKLLPPLMALRTRHLELMVSQTSPGGQLLIIMDLVSSHTLPELAKRPSDLNRLITRALDDGNFFPGANPRSIDEMLFRHPPFQGQFSRLDISQPWVREDEEDFIASIAFRIEMKD